MVKVLAYTLLYAGTPNALTQEVQNYLQDGWEPLGAPFAAPFVLHDKSTQTFYYQAVIKK